MMKSNMTAMTLAGILSVSSVVAVAQSSGGSPPVDKGGMPPSTQMDAGRTSDSNANANALPPGSVSGGNGGDASGSSTSPGTGSGSTSGGSTMGGDSSSSGTATGSSGGGSSGGSSSSSQ
ncbi:hypothetical protein [Pseudomonas corrugata]|uniref:hypothetical protein n=1 Tax=Pseudomonas corrugata TaxID=47879 RepID=UPI001585F8BB|nr:hypothetical protein [Pseudomonas corrugata]MCI0993359.1 hypothetical protein [Pseudomonas corrugata]NUT68044.1 hypothetical protein [Pseudomonas corrugata]